MSSRGYPLFVANNRRRPKSIEANEWRGHVAVRRDLLPAQNRDRGAVNGRIYCEVLLVALAGKHVAGIARQVWPILSKGDDDLDRAALLGSQEGQLSVAELPHGVTIRCARSLIQSGCAGDFHARLCAAPSTGRRQVIPADLSASFDRNVPIVLRGCRTLRVTLLLRLHLRHQRGMNVKPE